MSVFLFYGVELEEPRANDDGHLSELKAAVARVSCPKCDSALELTTDDSSSPFTVRCTGGGDCEAIDSWYPEEGGSGTTLQAACVEFSTYASVTPRVYEFNVTQYVCTTVRVLAYSEEAACENIRDRNLNWDGLNWTYDKVRDWSINLSDSDDNIDDYNFDLGV